VPVTEPHPADSELVVLHALRCSGTSSTERVAQTVGELIAIDAEDVLLDLATRGLVTHDGGAFGGWRLTEAGRDADGAWVADELERSGARPAVRSAYDDFLVLNPQALDICTAWQVRSTAPLVLNEHTDRLYDAGVLRRLAAIDAEAQDLCGRLAARLGRFGRYGPRLASALRRARQGEPDLVSDSLDSYHTVWAQLHEDLLATLGLSRWADAD
jgi:hypothetical protein